MKGWFWIPLAGMAGLLVGSWGPRAELRAWEKQAEEERAKPKQVSDGFASLAKMVHIPDRARHPRRGGHGPAVRKGKQPQANDARRVDAPTNTVVETAAAETAAAERQEPQREWHPEDLRARIEEAQELWRTRVDVARAQWKEKLKLDAAGAEKFDAVLADMNTQLYDTMQALANQIESKKALTQELGLRLVGDATTILAETYDKIGAVVPAGGRETVSQMQMTDFIDPGVAEPLIAVQGQLERFAFPHQPHRGGR